MRSLEPSVPGPRVAVDLIGGAVLLAIVAVALLNAGQGRLDWIFPIVLSYALGVLGVYLVVRGLLGYGDWVAAVPPILRGEGVDVAVFVGLIVAYVLLVQPLGFWMTSIAMIIAGSTFLDTMLSVRRVMIAIVVAAGVCLMAYLLLTRVFYVPLPEVRWLPL